MSNITKIIYKMLFQKAESHKRYKFQNGKDQIKNKYNTRGKMSRTTQVLKQNS